MKKYIAIFCSFISIIFVIFVTFLCVPINQKLNFEKPDSIFVYNKTLTGIELSNDNQKSNYEKVYNEFLNMTNVSIFNRLRITNTVYYGISQDLSGSASSAWNSSMKGTHTCIEFRYSKFNKVLVNLNGNTRLIETKTLIFRIEGKNELLKVYYAINEDSENPQYVSDGKSYPLLITASTKEMLKIAKSL
ncbi:MAG: hypothetical protein RR334_00535 [Clostridia bacterium]